MSGCFGCIALIKRFGLFDKVQFERYPNQTKSATISNFTTPKWSPTIERENDPQLNKFSYFLASSFLTAVPHACSMNIPSPSPSKFSFKLAYRRGQWQVLKLVYFIKTWKRRKILRRWGKFRQIAPSPNKLARLVHSHHRTNQKAGSICFWKHN